MTSMTSPSYCRIMRIDLQARHVHGYNVRMHRRGRFFSDRIYGSPAASLAAALAWRALAALQRPRWRRRQRRS